MVNGECDKKVDYSDLTREELEWVMKNEGVSKEQIIEYSEQYARYRAEQAKSIENKGKSADEFYEKQINRLKNVIKTLE